MNRSLLRQLLAASACMLCTPLVFAADQNCAAMEASGPQWFARQLDGVQATYQSGNNQGAYQQLREAMLGLPRRADVSLDARCVGPQEWQRMYSLRRAITATLGKQSENLGKLANREGALDWYVLGNNRDDARRVIKQLTPTPEGTAFVINRLRGEISLLDHAQASGFELLPDERSAQEIWQEDLDKLQAYAREQVAGILEKENALLTRPATAQEEQLAQFRETQRTLVGTYLGDESLLPDNEGQRELTRGRASLEMLVTALDWSQAVADSDTAPVLERALMRGDVLMVQAGDASMGLEARDSLYELAGNYFEFAGSGARRQAAAQGRAAIGPALKAERDTRAAQTKKKGAELQESARQMKESMLKTHKEKQNFKDEADALESELGF